MTDDRVSRAFTKEDPPIIWTFSGPAAARTHFDLKIFGRPTAQSLRNICRQLELTATFLDEDTRITPPDALERGEIG